MRRASPPGPAPGETMRDPLTPPSDYVDHAAARRIVVGVLLTMLLAALDQVMVATALPTIAASLREVDIMSWVVTANLLCATAATPLYGKLSDIHGRRAMMLIAIGIYAAGSLACALAPSMLTLILGRALQGLGGGGLMPLWPRRAIARAIRPTPPRPSSYRPWVARSSPASLPSISIGLGFSGSICRSAAWPFCSPTPYCSACRATTVGTSSTCWALC